MNRIATLKHFNNFYTICEKNNIESSDEKDLNQCSNDCFVLFHIYLLHQYEEYNSLCFTL